MPRLLTFAAIALAAACASSPSDVDAAAAADAPTTWKQVMRAVDEQFEVLGKELSPTPPRDLDVAARAARRTAELLQLGYGRLHNARVPGFDRMARDAESWLLRIAAEAEQAHGPTAQSLFRAGESRHCQRCHDASEAARW